jgi:hypothetical protein
MLKSGLITRAMLVFGLALTLAGCVTSTRDLKVFQDNRDQMMLTSKTGRR